MKRLLRAVGVGTVGTAFLAVLLTLCPCPEMDAASGGKHDCCLPETGLRPAEGGCCPSLSIVPKVVSAPEVSGAPAPPPVGFSPVAVETHNEPPALRHAPPPVFSPPPVLRV